LAGRGRGCRGTELIEMDWRDRADERKLLRQRTRGTAPALSGSEYI
jgi:hypothetical protein